MLPVPSSAGIYVDVDGNVYSDRQGSLRMLKKCPNANGYPQYQVGVGRSGQRVRYAHQLVMETFVGPRPEGMEVRHINGDPSDNRLENLAYGTHKRNYLDNALNGTQAYGENHHAVKLSYDEVLDARNMRNSGMTYRSIADALNISLAHAWRIVNRTRRAMA